MIAVMLLHGICGCCWHHGHHECSGIGCVQVSTTGGETVPICRHGGHAHAGPQDSADVGNDAERPGAPHDHDEAPCSQETCVYMMGKSLEFSPSVPFALNCSLERFLPVEKAFRSTMRVETVPFPRDESALAACARLQVWNI